MMMLTRASKFCDAADMFSRFKLNSTGAVIPRACRYVCSMQGCTYLNDQHLYTHTHV